MKLKKSSWNKFAAEAKTGLAYMGSVFGKGLEPLIKHIDDTQLHDKEFYIDRTLVSGASRFKFEKDTKGEYSYLDKRGKVYEYGKFFLIHDEKHNNNVIVYSKVGK